MTKVERQVRSFQLRHSGVLRPSDFAFDIRTSHSTIAPTGPLANSGPSVVGYAHKPTRVRNKGFGAKAPDRDRLLQISGDPYVLAWMFCPVAGVGLFDPVGPAGGEEGGPQGNPGGRCAQERVRPAARGVAEAGGRAGENPRGVEDRHAGRAEE